MMGHKEMDSTFSHTVFGFWIYLLTDLMLFSALFATYLVLKDSTFGGPSGKELFSLSYAATQTILLLGASFTTALAAVHAHRKNKIQTTFFFLFTFLLGCLFLARQLSDFRALLVAGHGWNQSAFLSTWYTLIGTHTLHLVIALIWIPLILLLLYRDGFSTPTLRRIVCLKLFWQFLNLIWVAIFTFVYLWEGIR